MAQNKTDKKQDIKTDAPVDTRAAVQPQFVLDNREVVHLAVARPSKLFPIVFVLMANNKNLLDIYTEQRTFKTHENAINYENAVSGMIAANYAMRPKVMEIVEENINRFNDAMQKMTDQTGFWNIPHTR